MKLFVGSDNLKKIKTDSIIKFITTSGFRNDPILSELNRLSPGAIKKLFDSGEFEGKLNQTVVLHRFPGVDADRIILVGRGEKKLDGMDEYRQGGGTVSSLPALKKSDTIAFYFGPNEEPNAGQAVMEGYLLGGFKMNEYMTGDNARIDFPHTVSFYIENKSSTGSLKKAVVRGQIIAESVLMARRFTLHPGNILTPRKFASEIRSLARKFKFSCQILDEKKIAAEKMGALLAVAKGSNEPPLLAIMKYNGAKKAGRPVVLIGKGITFDTGGISLKASLDMGEMKGDMQGAAVMVGTMVAAARLKLPINLVGLAPLAENMPSSKATRPGDIVVSRKGKTIEIINTDAEGRLILADALDYANKFKPQAVFDVATLTGAAKFILGAAGIPFLTNNSKLAKALFEASHSCAEKIWRLPIWNEHRDMMKSSIADLKNSAGREAGTIVAAAFLENFIGDWPWAHIDIAAVDVEKKGRPYVPKGVSARGLRLLVEVLIKWKNM